MKFVTLPGFTQLFFIPRAEVIAQLTESTPRVGAEVLNDISSSLERGRQKQNKLSRQIRSRVHGAQFPALQAQDHLFAGLDTSVGYDAHNQRYVIFGFLNLSTFMQKAFLARNESYAQWKGAA